jgi:hypothetical protein
MQSFWAFSEWLLDNPELVAVLVVFAFLIVVFHVVLVYWMKISNTVWKFLDYFWYVPAVVGIILAYYSILDRDLRRELDTTIDALDIYVGAAIDFVAEERQSSCALAFPEATFEEPNFPSHPMVLPPPDRSIFEQEGVLTSKSAQVDALKLATSSGCCGIGGITQIGLGRYRSKINQRPMLGIATN